MRKEAQAACVFVWAILMPSLASAGIPVPDPTKSTVPSYIRVVGTRNGIPDPTGTFIVTVRDATSLPIAGSVVTADFSRCSDTVLSLAQAPDVMLACQSNSVSGITNALGQATFTIVGAGNVAPCATPPACPPGAGARCIHVCADGFLLATATSVIYDLDGALAPTVGDVSHTDGINSADYAIVLSDVGCANSGGPYRGRSDFSTDGAINNLDISAYLGGVLGPALEGKGSADGSGRATFCNAPFAPYCP